MLCKRYIHYTWCPKNSIKLKFRCRTPEEVPESPHVCSETFCNFELCLFFLFLNQIQTLMTFLINDDNSNSDKSLFFSKLAE